MSSSLLEILSLMEQAVKEQQSSAGEENTAYIDKPPEGISGKSKDILDVDKIVRLIYNQSEKDSQINPAQSFKTLRDINQSKIEILQNSEQIKEAIVNYFVPPDFGEKCSNMGQLLSRALVNQAYGFITDPKNFDPSAGGFENEKLMAYLLGGKWITTADGEGDIADIKVGDIGISLKTKKEDLTVGGSYRNLLTTLGINFVQIRSPKNMGYAAAVAAAKSRNFKAEIRKPSDGKAFSVVDYNKLDRSTAFAGIEPKHSGGLFYVAFVKKEDGFTLKVWQVTPESAKSMVQSRNRGQFEYEDGSVSNIFEFTSKGLLDIKNSFLGKKMSEVDENTPGVTEYKTIEISFEEIKEIYKRNNESIYPQLTNTLNTLNAYMGLMVDTITNYSINPNEENLTTVKDSLNKMSGFTIKTQQNCQSPMQESLQEAFSVSTDDLEKRGYAKDRNQTQPHPAKFIHRREILDNRDLDEFFRIATKKILSDETVKPLGLNSVSNKLSQLIVVADAVPEREEYLNDLSDTINKLYNHWMDPERIKTSKQIIGTITNAINSSNNEQLKQIADDRISTAQAELEAQAEKEQEAGQVSITSPTFKTSRLPGNLEDYNAVMARMFGESDSLRARIEDLKKLAVFFGKPEEEFKQRAEEMNPLDFFARVVMMDYLVEIAKGFDSTAGRYLLEYLLAVVAKGRVTGADLGDSGMAGAVDFQSEGGFGSSKFLSSYEDALQSVKAFKDGQTVTYVVAVRQGNPTKLKTRAPSPLELQGIKMHIFDIKKTKNTFKIEVIDVSGQKKIINIGNYKKDFSLTDEKDNITHLNIGKIAEANRRNAFTIPLVFTTEEGTKTYRQMMSTSLGETKKELLTIVKDLFDGLKKADTMSRKYVVTGDADDGAEALDELDKSYDNLLSLSGFAGTGSSLPSD